MKRLKLFLLTLLKNYFLSIFHIHSEPKLAILHSRYMKMQHIKFEILNGRLFKCNLIQLNFTK